MKYRIPRQGFDSCISQFQLSSVILFCIVDKTLKLDGWRKMNIHYHFMIFLKSFMRALNFPPYIIILLYSLTVNLLRAVGHKKAIF